MRRGCPCSIATRPAASGLGALWGYVGDENVAAYLYASTAKKNAQRPGELGPEEMLSRRTGYTVADASNLFDQSFERPDLIECGCNMHGRRYWTKALDAGDTRAALAIAAYKKLYEIEAKIRALAPDEKRTVRQAESKPVFDEIVSWAKAYKPYEPAVVRAGRGDPVHDQAQGRAGTLPRGPASSPSTAESSSGSTSAPRSRARTTSLPAQTPAASAPRSPTRSSAAADSPT